jgi:predicted nucleic acid-binding protein
MDALDLSGLPDDALLLLDSAPIICLLEGRPELEPRYQRLFEEHSKGHVRFAVTTITIAESIGWPARRR